MKFWTLNKGKKGNVNEPEVKPFINYSKVEFTREEIDILQKGPKFVQKERKANYRRLIPQIESALDSIPVSLRDQVRSDIFQSVRNVERKTGKNFVCQKPLLDEIKNKDNIVFLRTDKTGKLAVLDRDEYRMKMKVFLKENKCIELFNDPIKTMTNKTNELIDKRPWPNGIKAIEKKRTATTPNIFGRLKDHKQNMPIRPIVEKCQGVTYPIEKALVTIMRACLPASLSTVQSTKELIESLRVWRLERDDRLASLDIISLYPSIDVEKAKSNFLEQMKKSDRYEEEEITTVESAINLIVENNVFRFENRFFRQTRGCPMGSPISGLMAEYILGPLEKEIEGMKGKTPMKWVRYVDDILIVWRGNEDELQKYVEDLNLLNKDIQFTYEFEKNEKIAFLDVEITRGSDGLLMTKVFRKPMACNPLMPRETSTLKSYKLAGIRSQIVRANAITQNKKDFDEEIEKIRRLAEEKGYGSKLVLDMAEKIRNKSVIKTKEDLKFGGSVEYWPGITERVKRVFMKYGVRIAVKPRPSIFKRLRNDRDEIDPMEKSGVYEIPFNDEDGVRKTYVGQTIRKIAVRRKEHIGYVARAKDTTELSKKANNENIEIFFGDTTRIASFKTPKEGIIRETIEIKRRGASCIAKPSVNVPGIWNRFLFHKNKNKSVKKGTC